MNLSIIAAVAVDGVIGRDNALPWKLPDDLKRFKALTMGHEVVMGRRTFESIGRPLPGRRLIVVTRRGSYRHPGVTVVHSIDEALRDSRDEEVFVAGGADIYAQTIDRVDRLYLTLIDRRFEGDARFPDLGGLSWRLVSEEPHVTGEPIPYRFVVFDRQRQELASAGARRQGVL